MKKGLYFLSICILLTWSASYVLAADTSRGKVNTNKIIIYLSHNLPIQISKKELVDYGERIVFGTEDPKAISENGERSYGKGQCPRCHQFLGKPKSSQSIPLIKNSGIYSEEWNHNLPLERRSHLRIQEKRYQDSRNRYISLGEPELPHIKTGMIPRAETGGEYLIESLYCPNCYVVERHGIKGTNDMFSGMHIINKDPIMLNDFEIIAVVAYLQAFETPGDYSKVTALEDWEHYFNKKFMFSTVFRGEKEHALKKRTDWINNNFTSRRDTPEVIIKKMGCSGCHKIPGLTDTDREDGHFAPILNMKMMAERRFKSEAYKKAVKRGKARATNPRGYVIESIIDHEAFIVPGSVEVQLEHYRDQFTIKALERLADFILE